jgi:hypothetical protein
VTEPIDFERLCDLAWEYDREDRLLPLRGEHWFTGRGAEGVQLLVAVNDADADVLRFDSEGRLASSDTVPHDLTDLGEWSPTNDPHERVVSFLRDTIGFKEGTIHVRCFNDDRSGFAVKLLPHWFESFIRVPEQTPEKYRKGFAENLHEWIEKRDTYVLEWQGNTFFIDSNDGHCTAS